MAPTRRHYGRSRPASASEDDDDCRNHGRITSDHVDDRHRRRRDETDRRTDDRGYGQLDDPDANCHSSLILYLEEQDYEFRLSDRQTRSQPHVVLARRMKKGRSLFETGSTS